VTDNVVLSAGTADGVTLATDDVGGIHYQIIKLTYGALDSATLVSTSNGLPVAQQGTWNVNNVSGTVSLPTGAATAAKQPALGTAGTASTDVLTVQGIASMTPLLVNASGNAVPVTDNSGSLTVDGTVAVSSVGGTVAVTQSGAWSLSANQSVNVAQLAGTTTDTNSGVKSAGTLRVVLATDQPQLTNKLLVTPDSVALPANQSVNVSQINGVTPLMGNGVTGTGSQRVTIASDNTAFTVNAAQSGTWTVQPGNTANTTPWLTTSSHTTTGGLTVATGSITATATSIKGSAGQVYVWYFYNPNASVAYVQFFNTASGSVTLGTTSPVYSLGIPATSGANVEYSNGIAHSTAITIAVTTTRAGSTSPGSSVDYNIFYK